MACPEIPLEEGLVGGKDKPLREVWHPPESVLTKKSGYACGG